MQQMCHIYLKLNHDILSMLLQYENEETSVRLLHNMFDYVVLARMPRNSTLFLYVYTTVSVANSLPYPQ